MSTPSAAAGRPASDLPPRRPFQGGGRFDRPVMSQDKIDALIRQARDNAKRLMLEALQKTDPKYRSFIVPIGQWKKVGESGDRDIKAHVELPYMSVDGRVLMAIDEHMAQGKKIIIQPAEFKDDPVSGQKLCQVTVKAELRGEATGTARLFLGGGGANRDNPVENAQTSAIGRALGFLGYGCFGTGIASADEMITALGGDPSRAEVTRDPHTAKAAAAADTPALAAPPTGAPAPERTLVPVQRGEPEHSREAVVLIGVQPDGQPPTPAPAPADNNAQGLLEALTARTLGRDQLAATATTLLQVPKAGYVAYLTRTFGVTEPEKLSDAQLKKEIEFLLRRTQHTDQAERFRTQCAQLAQQAA